MPKKKCHAFPTIFTIVLISCSEFVLAELGGAGGLVSQFATEFSDTGSQVLLDGREGHDDSWGAELLDEDTAANGSSVFNGGLGSASSHSTQPGMGIVYEEAASNDLVGPSHLLDDPSDEEYWSASEGDEHEGYEDEREEEEELEYFECVEDLDVFRDLDPLEDAAEEEADAFGVTDDWVDVDEEEGGLILSAEEGLSVSISTAEFRNKEWFGSDWDPILSLEEIEKIQYLKAVDGGGTLTKIIYSPCPEREKYILQLCCGLVPRDWFLDKFMINTDGYSDNFIRNVDDSLRRGFLTRLKQKEQAGEQAGFLIPAYPKGAERQYQRVGLPVTGGLAAQLLHEQCPLRDLIVQQDEVKSLAHGLAIFMMANDMRAYSAKTSRFPLQGKQQARDTRAIYVDMGERKPFISQIDDGRESDSEEMDVQNASAHRTISRKGIDATTFAYWFSKICKVPLRQQGITYSDVLDTARDRVLQRMKIEQDQEARAPILARIETLKSTLDFITNSADYDPQFDNRTGVKTYRLELERLQSLIAEDIDFEVQEAMLNELHSAFHVKIVDIYPDGYAGLNPLIAAAFMAKAAHLEKNAGKDEVKNWAMNFVMGYLEMVAQNAVSLARHYQQKQGAKHVIFSGQLVGTATSQGAICRAFMMKYVRRLFGVEPLLTENFVDKQRTPLQHMERDLLRQYRGQVGDTPAAVTVWFHTTDMPHSTWQSIQLMSRTQGVGKKAVGDSIKKSEIGSARCCAPPRGSTTPAQSARKSFVFASIGTGSPVAKVDLDERGRVEKVLKIGGSAIGGGTSVGLLKAAFPADTNFDDQVARPLTESSWQIIQMVARGVAEIVSLLAILNDVDTVVFTGGFLQNNPEAESWMVNVCLELGLKVLFQKPDKRGFTAAVGAHALSGGLDQGATQYAPLRPGGTDTPRMQRVMSPENSRNTGERPLSSSSSQS